MENIKFPLSNFFLNNMVQYNEMLCIEQQWAR